MYIVIRTRPNIAFTVTCLSQFLTKPTKKNFGAIKHVFRYLKGTRDIRLSFPYSQQKQHNALILEGFTDSDFAVCSDTHRSTSAKKKIGTICARHSERTWRKLKNMMPDPSQTSSWHQFPVHRSPDVLHFKRFAYNVPLLPEDSSDSSSFPTH